MSDFARFLPLSNRPHDDEGAVSSDRHVLIADIVQEAARVVVAGGVEPNSREQIVAGFLENAGLTSRLRPAEGPSDPLLRLDALSAEIRGGRKRGIRDLVRATRGLLQLAASLHQEAALSPAASGAVALWAATSGPHERRVVLTGHTLRATDAGWEFGRGPVLEGRGIDIASFGVGVSEEPPQPPRTPEVSSPR